MTEGTYHRILKKDASAFVPGVQARVKKLAAIPGRSKREWAVAASCSTQAIQQWSTGSRPIHREAAWKLTRAAWRFGVELPPAGMVGYRKGALTKERRPPAPEHEARRLARLKESKWTLDQLMVLGTMPDRVVAEHLGKSRNSVAIMRRALGLDVLDLRNWDGKSRPQTVARQELQARWDRFRTETKERARLARQKMMSSLTSR